MSKEVVSSGSGASQWVELIRYFAYNTEVTFELATVISAPPDLSIQIDHMAVPLEKDDLIVCETLTKHEKTIKLTSQKNTIQISDPLGIGMTSIENEVPGKDETKHPHSILSVEISDGNLAIDEATIEYAHDLKKDERVLVLGLNKGQSYIIIDRVVQY